MAESSLETCKGKPEGGSKPIAAALTYTRERISRYLLNAEVKSTSYVKEQHPERDSLVWLSKERQQLPYGESSKSSLGLQGSSVIEEGGHCKPTEYAYSSVQQRQRKHIPWLYMA